MHRSDHHGERLAGRGGDLASVRWWVEAPVNTLFTFTEEGVRVRSTLPLKLKDDKIGGRSRVLGLFKMYPDIVVHVDVSFRSH
jgi:hypothetical protein